MNRHKGLDWAKLETKLQAGTVKPWSLYAMEETGGEPDVIGHDKKTGEYIFYDCSAESPKDRRSICYDHEVLEKRKEHKPADSAVNMAADMGIEDGVLASMVWWWSDQSAIHRLHIGHNSAW